MILKMIVLYVAAIIIKMYDVIVLVIVILGMNRTSMLIKCWPFSHQIMHRHHVCRFEVVSQARPGARIFFLQRVLSVII